MKLFEYYKKVGGKTFHMFANSKDDYFSSHFVFVSWFELSMALLFLLWGIDMGLLYLFDLSIEFPQPSFYPTGINFIDGFFYRSFINVFPFILNYFVFVYKKKYLVYMEKYKDEGNKLIYKFLALTFGLGYLLFLLRLLK